MKVDAADALDLSRRFFALSVELGEYRFEHWDLLPRAQRQRLEDIQWSLLNASSDITTLAVGLVLDESELGLARLRQTTSRARRALRKLDDVRRVLAVATRAVALAGALMARDPAAVVNAARALYEAAAR